MRIIRLLISALVILSSLAHGEVTRAGFVRFSAKEPYKVLTIPISRIEFFESTSSEIRLFTQDSVIRVSFPQKRQLYEPDVNAATDILNEIIEWAENGRDGGRAQTRDIYLKKELEKASDEKKKVVLNQMIADSRFVADRYISCSIYSVIPRSEWIQDDGEQRKYLEFMKKMREKTNDMPIDQE